jgi:hypothetical protein
MIFQLKKLYLCGVRLTDAELADSEAVVGNLVIFDWAEKTGKQRKVKHACLKTTNHATVPLDVTVPLFDPVLLRMTDSQMILAGFEIDMGEGVARHYVQHWALRSV